MPASSLALLLLPVLLLLSFANLPAAQVIGARAYMLQMRMECKGGKVYDIDNVQDIEQCKEACRQFDCSAVNLFQLGEFQFKCEILNSIYGMVPATGAACYYASDSYPGAGAGFGSWGRRK